MGSIRINGIDYSGDNISIRGNKVVVNGIDVTPDAKEISIVVEGNISEIKVDSCNEFRVVGDVGRIKTMSGDVDVEGNVTGDVETMSGDVSCLSVGGNVKTMS
jgi:RecJ-like exonuclease